MVVDKALPLISQERGRDSIQGCLSLWAMGRSKSAGKAAT